MANKTNLLIDQGAAFSTTINVTDANNSVVDLTGYSSSAQMRKHYSSSNSYAFSVTISPLLGAVTMSMTSNYTSNVVAGRYVYDCEITDPNGSTSRLVEGIVTVSAGVTR